MTLIVEIQIASGSRYPGHCDNVERLKARIAQSVREAVEKNTIGPEPEVKVGSPCSLCGSSPERGGRRRGSALCEACFHDDTR
ncbi:MAG: hypothetical protein U1F65_05830 [Verrucomicrobiota bacterium]